MTQQQLLKLYRNEYPNDTFKVISKKTNIQQTRVFRIFNGSEMKLSEYEIFSNILISKDTHQLISMSQKCINNLPKKIIKNIYNEMNIALLNYNLLSGGQ